MIFSSINVFAIQNGSNVPQGKYPFFTVVDLDKSAPITPPIDPNKGVVDNHDLANDLLLVRLDRDVKHKLINLANFTPGIGENVIAMGSTI